MDVTYCGFLRVNPCDFFCSRNHFCSIAFQRGIEDWMCGQTSEKKISGFFRREKKTSIVSFSISCQVKMVVDGFGGGGDGVEKSRFYSPSSRNKFNYESVWILQNTYLS